MKEIKVYRDSTTNRFISKHSADVLLTLHNTPVQVITCYKGKDGRFVKLAYKWNFKQYEAFRKFKEEQELKLFYGKTTN